MAMRPPLYPGLPLLGSSLSFRSNPLEVLARVAHSAPLPRFKIMRRTGVVVQEPSAIQHVLVSSAAKYSIGVGTRRMFRYWIGDGIFTAEGDAWRLRRRMMQPLFHRQAVRAFSEIMTEEAAALSSQWQQQADAVDMHRQMMGLTLRVVTKALFHTSLDDEALETFTDAVNEMVEVFTAWVTHPLAALVPEHWIQQHPRFRRALATMDQTVEQVIGERRRGDAAAEGETDLLALLLNARSDDGYALSDREVRDEVMTMLFGGHETTATALAWMWYALAQHPEAEARLHEELAVVLGGRPATAEDLPNLPYTRMVIQESLRLYPPVWSILRVANEDDVIDGYQIRSGDRIVICPWLIHRLPQHWERAEAFDPSRWSDGFEPTPWTYLPYGAGQRQCMGKHFADMEMQIILATLAQHTRPRLDPQRVVAPHALLTVRPRGGLTMRLAST